MKMTKVTTRGHEASPQVHSLCLSHERDPWPESLEILKSLSSFSPVAHCFTGNGALGRLALFLLLYLRCRRTSCYRQGGPGAHSAGG